MASDLYETLGVSRTASAEEIRTAYKQKALRTHPDKVPEERKAEAAEEFRQVSAAYEVLRDTEKRKLYDVHGVWPPPERTSDAEQRAGSERHRSRHSQRPRDFPPFSDPFLPRGFHDFVFTDPFVLFDSMFGHSGRQHHRSRTRHANHFDHDMAPPFSNFFDRFERDFHDTTPPFSNFFDRIERDFIGSSMFHGRGSLFNMLPPAPSFGNWPDSFGRHGQPSGSGWTSQAFASRTINGVTHTIESRRDSNGTEYVVRTNPDGSKVHTINGVEQPHGYLPQGVPPPPMINSTHSTGHRSPPPPPPYGEHPRHDTAFPATHQERARTHRHRTRSEAHPTNLITARTQYSGSHAGTEPQPHGSKRSWSPRG